MSAWCCEAPLESRISSFIQSTTVKLMENKSTIRMEVVP
uniref:Uncharacterized protein n=1 Tax=Arundo donax TaxID=35708 RepID=A0A0A9EGY7_ARUDO